SPTRTGSPSGGRSHRRISSITTRWIRTPGCPPERASRRVRLETSEIRRRAVMGIVHTTMTDEQRKSVALEYLKSLDRGSTSDERPFLELFAEDAVVYFPKWGVAHGRSEIGKLFGDVG